MAKYAVCSGFNSAMTPDDETMLNLETNFFNTDGASTVVEDATIAVSIGPNQNVDLIHEAMVDVIVAYTLNAYGWVVPRSKVIHPLVARGSVI